MGASASVERSPLVLRASLLMRFHSSNKHRRTLAQAVYSGLYQSGEWSTWVLSEHVFRVLWKCISCENNAPALEHVKYLQALGVQCDVHTAADVMLHGEDMIAFLASGRLPVRHRQLDCKQSTTNGDDDAVKAVTTTPTSLTATGSTAATTIELPTTLAPGSVLSDDACVMSESNGVNAETTTIATSHPPPATSQLERDLSSLLSIDHLVTLQEWVLTPDRSGRSPLDYAQQANNVELLQRMHVTLAGGSCSPVHTPSRHQAEQIPHSPSSQGSIFPLHVAAKAGKLDVIKSLLAEGMDPFARDEQDNLPIYYTCLCGHLDCCAHLAELAGGVHSMEPEERLRCSTNALNQRLRQYLQTGVLPADAPPQTTDDADGMTDDMSSDLSMLFS